MALLPYKKYKLGEKITTEHLISWSGGLLVGVSFLYLSLGLTFGDFNSMWPGKNGLCYITSFQLLQGLVGYGLVQNKSWAVKISPVFFALAFWFYHYTSPTSKEVYVFVLLFFLSIAYLMGVPKIQEETK